jgi:GT2 family glycosyltransferase
MLKSSFQTFKVLINPQPKGSVGSRDRLMRAALGDIVLSLDDDSYPLEDDFFGRLEILFESHPEAAVITFPELRDNGDYGRLDKSPAVEGHYVSAYPNCAAATRRSFYLQCSGFPSLFVHAYEEPDFALQCYQHGMTVWFEPSLTIRHHLSSTNRRLHRTHCLNARNELWSVWMRCPWPKLIVVSAFRIWRQFRYAMTQGVGWTLWEPTWWLSALSGLSFCYRNRRPVDWTIYYEWMRLARQPLRNVNEVQKRFGAK